MFEQILPKNIGRRTERSAMKLIRSLKGATAVLAAAALLGSVNSSPATLRATEPFDFVGTRLNAVGSGTGWGANLWTASPTPGLVMSADGTSLVYPAGAAFAVAGQRVRAINTGGINTYRVLDSQFSLASGNGSYYVSFLAKKDATGTFRIEANNSANNKRWHPVQVSADGGVSVQAGTTIGTISAGAFANNTTYLVVAKFLTGSVPNAYVKLYKSGDTIPSSDSGLSWTATATGPATGVSQDRFNIALTAGVVELDEFRFGTTWADVVCNTATAVTSSANPAAPGANVTFTATVSSASGIGTPSGTVTFKDAGVALGSAMTLNGSGQATLSTSSLAHGSHSITAEYGGATGFNPSTNTPLIQVMSTPPVAQNISMGAQSGVKQILPIIGIAKYPPTDADIGDVLTLTAVSYTSGNGATVAVNGNNLEYTSASGFIGADSFTYTVSDNFGGVSAPATVTVNVMAVVNQLTTELTFNGSGQVVLGFWGIPGVQYTIQKSSDLTTWTDLTPAVTTQPNGQINYMDTGTPSGTAGYYRLKP